MLLKDKRQNPMLPPGTAKRTDCRQNPQHLQQKRTLYLLSWWIKFSKDSAHFLTSSWLTLAGHKERNTKNFKWFKTITPCPVSTLPDKESLPMFLVDLLL